MDALTAAQACAYDSWFDTGWGAHAWAVECRAVESALPVLAGLTLVEVGCGTGRLVQYLSDRGARTVGVDLAAGMLAVAAGRVPGRFLRADASRLPLADASVDGAVTVATLEFTDAAAVLAELARVTRPGGRIVAVTLNPASLWGLLDRPTRGEPFASGSYLTRAELRHLGSRHGRARVRGRLFTAARPGFLHHLEPLATFLGRAIPRLGAVQVLIIDEAP